MKEDTVIPILKHQKMEYRQIIIIISLHRINIVHRSCNSNRALINHNTSQIIIIIIQLDYLILQSCSGRSIRQFRRRTGIKCHRMLSLDRKLLILWTRSLYNQIKVKEMLKIKQASDLLWMSDLLLMSCLNVAFITFIIWLSFMQSILLNF